MISPAGNDDAVHRGAFASLVAHELRTPLTTVHGALEMISRAAASPAPDGERTAQLIALAHRGTQRLLRIVEDCLDLEAASDGRLVLEPTLAAPACIVELGLDGAHAAREQAGVPVVLRLHATRGLVADHARLGRALAHLVQNAVTVAPRGSVVTVSTHDDDAHDVVRFTVEDDGPGIAPDQLRALFTRFDVRETPGRRRVAGLGMGLAFVRTMAEAHAGTVGATSRPGHTSIWFEVPRRREATTKS